MSRLRQLKNVTKLSAPAGQRSGLFVVLFIVILTISLLGLLMILSASSHVAHEFNGSSWYWFRKQLVWFILGLVAFVVALRVPYHFWGKIAKPLLLLSFLLLILVMLPKIGVSVNGARRWVDFRLFRIQPVELAKLSGVFYFSSLLHSRRHKISDPRLSVRPVMVITILLVLFVILQPDLGSAIVLGVISLTILFAAGAPWRSLALWITGGVASAGVLSLTASYRRQRLFSFLDPFNDPLDSSYQTLQSLVAVASGGWFGRGIGAGRAKWGYLPFAHTDFIFSVVAEELGLFGAATLILAFVILCIGGILVALRARDLMGTALAAGITGWIGMQFILNIGASMGVLPITGITLPLVSFGGTSLIITMMALGVLLNVARFSRVPIKSSTQSR